MMEMGGGIHIYRQYHEESPYAWYGIWSLVALSEFGRYHFDMYKTGE